ncbi:MAG TPA: phosphatidylserine decarboxylase [Elusimicrobiales bacterium]|nr:phosphatidylserine decarboxylase [Elusimicrobiales bacterium]
MKDLKRAISAILEGTGNLPAEGRKIVRCVLLITLLTILASLLFHKSFFILTALFAMLVAFCIFFFRNPKREDTFKPDEIVSPADGRVLSIKTEGDPNILVVRIFLSVFDVHVQRSPVKAKVETVKYTKGKFAFASNDDAKNNERNLIQLANEKYSVGVEQITGAIARRIRCWVKEGDDVNTAQDVGIIFFGSQVALYLPAGKVRILIKEGQKVQGGLTLIGLWQN